jgi:Sec-independent protein translocase protein TatA
MKFFSLGAGEILLIVLFAILAVGPKETAKLAQQAGEVVKNVRGMFNELTSEITRSAANLSDEIDLGKETSNLDSDKK